MIIFHYNNVVLASAWVTEFSASNVRLDYGAYQNIYPFSESQKSENEWMFCAAVSNKYWQAANGMIYNALFRVKSTSNTAAEPLNFIMWLQCIIWVIVLLCAFIFHP